MALKRAGFCCEKEGAGGLTAESVKGSSLAFQSVHDIESGDGLSLGVLGVGDGVADDVLEEDLEHSSGFFVNQAGDSLDTASAGETPDCRLGDSLDVITQDFSVTLGASFSQSLSSLATSGHVAAVLVRFTSFEDKKQF